jgi:20S proteasome alpha/beta subunit
LNNWENQPAEAMEYIQSAPVALMLAYYHDDKPHLLVLRSVVGFATPQKNYAAIGCGAPVAEFVLGRCDTSKMEFAHGLFAGIYAVEEVKRVDPNCGGPTRAAVVFPTGILFSDTEKKPIIRTALEVISKNQDDYNKKWNQLLSDLSEKVARRWKELKTLEPE